MCFPWFSYGVFRCFWYVPGDVYMFNDERQHGPVWSMMVHDVHAVVRPLLWHQDVMLKEVKYTDSVNPLEMFLKGDYMVKTEQVHVAALIGTVTFWMVWKCVFMEKPFVKLYDCRSCITSGWYSNFVWYLTFLSIHQKLDIKTLGISAIPPPVE